jgi:zinc protease
MSGQPSVRSLLILLILPLLGGCLTAFPFGSGSWEGVADPAVRHGELANGLTYFIRENREPGNRAELRLVVDAGSVLEDQDQRGLAHVIEHMAFNGTRNFAKQEIVDYLESIGMRFGPDVNAYTGFDETVYMLTVPTDSAGILVTGIQILEDWARGIEFDSLQVELERGVVIEEWRLGQGAGSRLQYRQFPTLTHRSRYSERLPIGTYASLSGFTIEALRRFYDDWYRPDLMAVIAVGDFDGEEVEAIIRERFESIPPPEERRRRPEFEIPSHQETLISVATDPELTSTSVSLYLKRRPRPNRGAKDYRDWMVESLTSAMLVNRLSEYAQMVDPPLLDVSSYHGRFLRPLSTLALNARVPDDRMEEGTETMLLEIERAARHGFTATELEREKNQMLRVMEQRYAERERTTSSSYASDYVSHFLYGGRVLDLEHQYELYLQMIPGVSLRQTNAVVRGWTSPADRVLLVSAPERDGVEIPGEAALARLVQRVGRLRLAEYEDVMSDAPLIREPPSPGAIVAEREIEELDALVWELENGSTFILKPTSFREDEILFAARSPGGTSVVEDDDFIAALTAAAVVQSGGVGELSALDLRKRLTGRVAGVGADIGEYHEGLSGAASPRDLELLFQLAYLKFVAPRPDTLAFLAYRNQAQAALANRAASPELAFQDTLRLVLTQNHPRSRPPSAAMFDELDMRRSFEIYFDRFADASDFTFFLVGSFDPEEVRPLVQRYIATLPDLGRVETGVDRGIRPPTGVIQKVVRRGTEPRAVTQIVFSGPFEFERANVLALQSLADVLRIRLRESLREALGGTYGVEVRASTSKEPFAQYQFSLGFGADPDRIAELSDVTFREIQDLMANGPSATDITKVREMQFRARESDLRQNYFWISQLLLYNQYGWDPAQIPTAARRLTDLTTESIREAAVQYLDTSNYVQVSLLPESGGSPPGPFQREPEGM